MLVELVIEETALPAEQPTSRRSLPLARIIHELRNAAMFQLNVRDEVSAARIERALRNA